MTISGGPEISWEREQTNSLCGERFKNKFTWTTCNMDLNLVALIGETNTTHADTIYVTVLAKRDHLRKNIIVQ